MDYQTSTGPVRLQDGDTFEMHDGRPTLMRDGKPVAVAWANAREDFEIRVPVPVPEPLFYVEFEQTRANSEARWTLTRMGPMPKAQAKYWHRVNDVQHSCYIRNVRIVPASPREMWAVVGMHSRIIHFVCDVRDAAVRVGDSLLDNVDVSKWDGKTDPVYGYLYATRQGV